VPRLRPPFLVNDPFALAVRERGQVQRYDRPPALASTGNAVVYARARDDHGARLVTGDRSDVAPEVQDSAAP